MPNREDTDENAGGPSHRYGSLQKRYVEIVHDLFPHMRTVLDRVLEESESFRDLVEEYGLCTEVLEQPTQHGRPNPPVKEYAALRLRLEGELLQYLRDYTDSHDS